MKARNKKSVRVLMESGDAYLTEGEPTVFGLLITPQLRWSGHFGDGFAITEPTTGYAICFGATKLHALRKLRLLGIKKRNEHGSFRAAIDEAKRNQRILQILKERAA